LKLNVFFFTSARAPAIIASNLRTSRMPQIMTASWFSKLPSEATPVGISRGVPRGKAGYQRLRDLQPGPWFKSVTPERYLALYSEILARLDPVAVRDHLFGLGDSPVMLCWEKAHDCDSGKVWCHRHLAAQWLEDRLGIEVQEVDFPNLNRFAFLRKLGIPAPSYRQRARPRRQRNRFR
jgi:hypothetical protein